MSHRYDDLTDYVLEKIHAGECDIAFHELENNVSQAVHCLLFNFQCLFCIKEFPIKSMDKKQIFFDQI